jgi:hypothetical protein
MMNCAIKGKTCWKWKKENSIESREEERKKIREGENTPLLSIMRYEAYEFTFQVYRKTHTVERREHTRKASLNEYWDTFDVQLNEHFWWNSSFLFGNCQFVSTSYLLKCNEIFLNFARVNQFLFTSIFVNKISKLLELRFANKSMILLLYF